jgi:hypothetical protein
MRTSANTDLIDAAIFEIQHRHPTITKAKEAEVGSHYKYKYATHEQVADEIRASCKELGIVIYQGGREGANGTQWLVTRVSCKGQFVEHDIRLEVAKAGSQAMGAAWSYNRRLGLMSVFGIVPIGEDTDAVDQGKTGKVAEPRQTKAARPASYPKDPHRALEEAREKLRVAETLADVESVAKSLNYFDDVKQAERTWVPKEFGQAIRDEIQSKKRELSQ